MASALVPLANITLASSAATVTFSSISGSYRDLYLVGYWAAATSNNGYLKIQFNSDTSTNYNFVTLSGNGSTTASTTSVSTTQIFTNYNTAPTATNFATSQTHIMDYSATDKHKTTIGRYSSASVLTETISGRWANTSAITTITLSFAAGNIYTGSTFALYGIASA